MKALVKIKVPAVTDKLKDAVREAEELDERHREIFRKNP